ncbi:amidohydrolase, partial [Mesorhizobium sp. M1A.F.Ca.IN.020.04.1.1]
MTVRPAPPSAAIAEAILDSADEFVALRRKLHSEPELAYQEKKTSALVAERLQAWGYQVVRNIGGTGVVGTLRNGNGGKSIGIRADMDALPIVEATGLPYA